MGNNRISKLTDLEKSRLTEEFVRDDEKPDLEVYGSKSCSGDVRYYSFYYKPLNSGPDDPDFRIQSFFLKKNEDDLVQGKSLLHKLRRRYDDCNIIFVDSFDEAGIEFK